MRKVLVVAAALMLSAGAASATTSGGWFSSGSKASQASKQIKVAVKKTKKSQKCFIYCGKPVVWKKKKVPSKPPSNPTSPVPVPAAGFLLLGGLGGLALMKRRKN